MGRAVHVLRVLAVAALLYGTIARPTFSGEPAGEGQALRWAIWGALAEAAKSCKSEIDARNFLDTAGMVMGDPEHSKVYSDVVETLAMEKPQCFLSAASSVQPHALQILIEDFLAQPKHHSPREIEASLAKYWDQNHYANIRKVYLDARR